MNDTNEMNEKLEFFRTREIKVHLELNNGRFYNGMIVEFETENVVVFNDRVCGMLHIFLTDIKLIEEFRE